MARGWLRRAESARLPVVRARKRRGELVPCKMSGSRYRLIKSLSSAPSAGSSSGTGRQQDLGDEPFDRLELAHGATGAPGDLCFYRSPPLLLGKVVGLVGLSGLPSCLVALCSLLSFSF